MPLEEDEPVPGASWPGETIESDAIPEPEATGDPDTEEQQASSKGPAR